jgi:nickel-type superoxide dismutase maturation protease
MEPTYRDGDFVLVDPRGYERRRPRPGDVVVAKHPFIEDRWMVKRVCTVDRTGAVRVIGDNRLSSTDSRSFGALSQVLGPVVARLP